jgi:hypothetical protein
MISPSSKRPINMVVDGPPRTTPCARCSYIYRPPYSSNSLPSLSISMLHILSRTVATPIRSLVSSHCHPFFTQGSFGSDWHYGSIPLIDVVKQEMLHLGLAGNILTSIGGQPILHGESYTPSFPVPIFFEDKLMLHLRPSTKENIKSFMEVSDFFLFIHMCGSSCSLCISSDGTARRTPQTSCTVHAPS